MVKWSSFVKKSQVWGYFTPAHDHGSTREYMDGSKKLYKNISDEYNRFSNSVDEYTARASNGALGGIAGGLTGLIYSPFNAPSGSTWKDYAKHIAGSTAKGAVEGAKEMFNERPDQAGLRAGETALGIASVPVNIADKILGYLGSDAGAAKDVINGVKLNEYRNTVERLSNGDVQESSRVPLGMAAEVADKISGVKYEWANWLSRNVTKPVLGSIDKASKGLTNLASSGMSGRESLNSIGNSNAAFNIGQATGTSMLSALNGKPAVAVAAFPLLMSSAITKSNNENNYLIQNEAFSEDMSNFFDHIAEKCENLFARK